MNVIAPPNRIRRVLEQQHENAASTHNAKQRPFTLLNQSALGLTQTNRPRRFCHAPAASKVPAHFDSKEVVRRSFVQSVAWYRSLPIRDGCGARWSRFRASMLELFRADSIGFRLLSCGVDQCLGSVRFPNPFPCRGVRQRGLFAMLPISLRA
jgi:hypothetical protein